MHRFAISYMHNTHRKKMVSGGLKSISGIGPAKYAALMKKFKTVSAVGAATVEELITVPGISAGLAKNIKDYFDGD